MPRSYITDISDLLDDRGHPVEGRAGRIARYLGLVVEAGSVMKEGHGGYIPMRCANPARRKLCASQLLAARPSRDTVEWECPGCGERGLITNWVGTGFDLRTAPGMKRANEYRDIIVPLDELDAMRRLGDGSPALRRLLVEAVDVDERYLVFLAGEDELSLLLESAQLAADRTRGEDRRLLDRFAARMDAFITTLPSFIQGPDRPDRLLN
jgi:hypothetical protein